VVTADWETHTARIWDLSDRVPVATVLSGHKGEVTSASFSPAPDGSRLITASTDGTAIIYPVPLDDDLRARAIQSVHRCLTMNQREELGLPLLSAGAATDADPERVDPPSACRVPGQTGSYMSGIAAGLKAIWTRTASALGRQPDLL